MVGIGLIWKTGGVIISWVGIYGGVILGVTLCCVGFGLTLGLGVGLGQE